MSIIINPTGVRQVSGYSHARVLPGTPVFVTGQVAWDLDGQVVGKGDIAVQVEKTWENIHAVLADLGASITDVVKLTTYATDARFMQVIGEGKARQFEAGQFPASTFLVVAGLADPDLLVEIEVIVMLRDDAPADS
ncbi:RidA family protein [Glaciihabitans sp. dw_435]|uniref:RidA family protein n=1 Tax=Glaciihabitans sp. dw_435 TaxID=2720081 RepID=UPI001BD6C422|nr:RidA family protein [Glaciihabitans sp. dw_435]